MAAPGAEPLPLASRWLADAGDLKASFSAAQPFPLLVLDDFLAPDLAEGLVREFPDLEAMPRSRDYVFGNKRELSSVENGGPSSERFHVAVTSESFAAFLAQATGFDVFVDPSFFGGGYHQGADGSFLDFHVDFNVHPLHRDWLRRLNILLYLNPEWRPEWGGDLLVKSSLDGEVRAVSPRFNRAVIMLTDAHTFHGYRKMCLPPGVTRKSLATYAYERIPEGQVAARTTGWAPERAGVVKRALARNYNTLVQAKNRVLGSGTAKNR